VSSKLSRTASILTENPLDRVQSILVGKITVKELTILQRCAIITKRNSKAVVHVPCVLRFESKLPFRLVAGSLLKV